MYEVILERVARKFLEKLDRETQQRIIQALRKLEQIPRPEGVKKLRGREAWRIRVGNYRIIYEIYDNVLKVVVIDIGHRQSIYR